MKKLIKETLKIIVYITGLLMITSYMASGVFIPHVNASGLTVDKMFVVADHNKNGVVTLANTSDSPLFIKSNIEEFILNDDGKEFIKSAYDERNFDDWKITTTRSKVVLQPGESRNIGIRSLCRNTTCDKSKDLMFFITFMPSLYRDVDKGDAMKTMQINYGFSPVFIIPTNEYHLDYSIENTGDSINVSNKSNTMINVALNNCNSKSSTNNACFSRFIVVAGRSRSFPLNISAKDKPLEVTVSNFNGEYKKKQTIKPSEIMED